VLVSSAKKREEERRGARVSIEERKSKRAKVLGLGGVVSMALLSSHKSNCWE